MKMRYGWHRRIAHFVAGIALALPLSIAGPQPSAQAANGSNTHAVKLASPAVIRIITDISAKVICNGCSKNSTGSADIVWPLDNTSTYRGQISGSGAFISPDGFALTADHVVDIDNNTDIQQGFINKAEDDTVTAFPGLTKTNVQEFFDQFRSSIHVVISVRGQWAFLSTSYTGIMQNISQVAKYSVTRIAANSTQQDVAIIKIELGEATSAPYLTFAPGNSIRVQDDVTAIAFPGDADTADFSQLISSTSKDINNINSLLSPSVNSGHISGQKTLEDGTQVYETDNIGFSGSSGGPVIDSQGRIIGFIDASSTSQRVNFLIPGEIAQQYIRQAGVKEQNDNTLMSLWTNAVNSFDANNPCHWANAAHDLRTLHERYPQFGGIQAMLDEANAKASSAECPSSSNGSFWLVFGGTTAIMVMILIIVAILFLRRHRTSPVELSPSTPDAATKRNIPQYPYRPDAYQYGDITCAPPPVLGPIYPAHLAESDDITLHAPSINAGSVPLGTAPVSKMPMAPATERRCLAGHLVIDDAAHFCPLCGQPI
jgi:S1-C subfamily serine protease